MKTKQQLLSELFLTCIELNDDNFTVFFDYSGHIDLIDVRICKFGYSFDSKIIQIGTLKIGDLFNGDECMNLIECITDIKAESTSERERLANDAEYKKKKRKEELLKELKELEK